MDADSAARSCGLREQRLLNIHRPTLLRTIVEQKTKGEIERMIFAALKPHHPDLEGVVIRRTRARWTCTLAWMAPPLEPWIQAIKQLTDLLTRYTIVDPDGT